MVELSCVALAAVIEFLQELESSTIPFVIADKYDEFTGVEGMQVVRSVIRTLRMLGVTDTRLNTMELTSQKYIMDHRHTAAYNKTLMQW